MDSSQLEQFLAPGGFVAVFVAAIGFVLREFRGFMKERNSDAVATAATEREKRIEAEGKRDEARAEKEAVAEQLYKTRQVAISRGVKAEDLP